MARHTAQVIAACHQERFEIREFDCIVLLIHHPIDGAVVPSKAVPEQGTDLLRQYDGIPMM